MASQVPAVETPGAPKPGSVRPGRRGKLAHVTRGRVRLQFPGSSPGELEQIESSLRGLPHVGKVEVHSRTGSIIVHHRPTQPGQFLGHLAEMARHSALFTLEGEPDPSAAAAQLTDVEHDAAYLVDHSKAGKAIVRYAEHLNRAVKRVTDGWIDLRVLLPAAAGISALVFVEIESAPLWLPLALFSFQSFNNLHQPHPTTEAEAPKLGSALSAGSPVPIEGTSVPPVLVTGKPVRRRKPNRRSTAAEDAEPAEMRKT